jgi:23S rRNA pseudouridine2605 synthase
MLNKPMGYITSMGDERGRLTVAELVDDCGARIFPVGRLDFNTTGLLIMTNDGDLAYRLTHPKHHFPKTYRLKAQGTLSKQRINRLEQGIDIGGYVTAPAKVKLIKQSERYCIAEIEIYEGKNRQVRKMFSAVGNKVLELKRIAMGDLQLGRMAEGQYRRLTNQEVEYLKKR